MKAPIPTTWIRPRLARPFRRAAGRWVALFSSLLLLCFVIPAKAAPLSGTKSVGPTGDYASLTAAIVDIQAETVGGALVLELQAAYLSSVETFPLTVPTLNGANAVNTVTIRPETGATALSITSADATAATVDLNGAQFVTFDGRPGGAGGNVGSGGGTASQLTIANTSIGGVALRFINEASGNTLRYTTLRGVTLSPSRGVVFFSTTAGANGNDDNTLDHCDIGDGPSTPFNGLYSLGTAATAAQNNSGNTVSNSNICSYHFASPTAFAVADVRLDGGNTDWTLTGNSFYQTVSRTAFHDILAIFLNPTGNNFTVTDNFIGGMASICVAAELTSSRATSSTTCSRPLRRATASYSPTPAPRLSRAIASPPSTSPGPQPPSMASSWGAAPARRST